MTATGSRGARPRTSRWTPAHVAELALTPELTNPAVDPELRHRTLPGLIVWDYWPVVGPDGLPVTVAGRDVWVALTAPDDIEPEARHDVARLRLASSGPDGRWHDHGNLFPDGAALGAREWAGSTVLDPATGALTVYYTAAGRRGETTVSYEQRIVGVRGQLVVDGDELRAERWGAHDLVFEVADDLYKVTAGTTGGPGQIDALRDPWFVHDPASGDDFLVFTASMPDGSSEHDGAVGIARLLDDGLHAELLPPLLTADGVNKELERPQVVLRDGLAYLFITTHHWTFAPGVPGYEGLYGFVAADLLGPYEPLNGHGLVLANPPEEPHQAYSWVVMPDGWVHAFIDYPGLAGRDLTVEAEADPGFRTALFGGCQAPLVHVELDGARSRVTDQVPPPARG